MPDDRQQYQEFYDEQMEVIPQGLDDLPQPEGGGAKDLLKLGGTLIAYPIVMGLLQKIGRPIGASMSRGLASKVASLTGGGFAKAFRPGATIGQTIDRMGPSSSIGTFKRMMAGAANRRAVTYDAITLQTEARKNLAKLEGRALEDRVMRGRQLFTNMRNREFMKGAAIRHAQGYLGRSLAFYGAERIIGKAQGRDEGPALWNIPGMAVDYAKFTAGFYPIDVAFMGGGRVLGAALHRGAGAIGDTAVRTAPKWSPVVQKLLPKVVKTKENIMEKFYGAAGGWREVSKNVTWKDVFNMKFATGFMRPSGMLEGGKLFHKGWLKSIADRKAMLHRKVSLYEETYKNVGSEYSMSTSLNAHQRSSIENLQEASQFLVAVAGNAEEMAANLRHIRGLRKSVKKEVLGKSKGPSTLEYLFGMRRATLGESSPRVADQLSHTFVGLLGGERAKEQARVQLRGGFFKDLQRKDLVFTDPTGKIVDLRPLNPFPALKSIYERASQKFPLNIIGGIVGFIPRLVGEKGALIKLFGEEEAYQVGRVSTEARAGETYAQASLGTRGLWSPDSAGERAERGLFFAGRFYKLSHEGMIPVSSGQRRLVPRRHNEAFARGQSHHYGYPGTRKAQSVEQIAESYGWDKGAFGRARRWMHNNILRKIEIGTGLGEGESVLQHLKGATYGKYLWPYSPLNMYGDTSKVFSDSFLGKFRSDIEIVPGVERRSIPVPVDAKERSIMEQAVYETKNLLGRLTVDASDVIIRKADRFRAALNYDLNLAPASGGRTPINVARAMEDNYYLWRMLQTTAGNLPAIAKNKDVAATIMELSGKSWEEFQRVTQAKTARGYSTSVTKLDELKHFLLGEAIANPYQDAGNTVLQDIVRTAQDIGVTGKIGDLNQAEFDLVTKLFGTKNYLRAHLVEAGVKTDAKLLDAMEGINYIKSDIDTMIRSQFSGPSKVFSSGNIPNYSHSFTEPELVGRVRNAQYVSLPAKFPNPAEVGWKRFAQSFFPKAYSGPGGQELELGGYIPLWLSDRFARVGDFMGLSPDPTHMRSARQMGTTFMKWGAAITAGSLVYSAADTFFDVNPMFKGTALDEGITVAGAEQIVKARLLGSQVQDLTGITGAMQYMEGLMPGSVQSTGARLARAAIPMLSFPTIGFKLGGHRGAAAGALAGMVAGSFGFTTDERDKQQLLEEYSGRKDVAVRKGRHWELSRSPFRGQQVDYFRPNWFARLKGQPMYTPDALGSKFEASIFANPPLGFNPIGAVVDPYHYERCAAWGTKLITERGLVPIENIAVGDKVLSKDGAFHSVLATHDDLIDEPLIKISIAGSHEKVSTTQEHRYYACRTKKCQGKSSRAKSQSSCRPKEWKRCESCTDKDSWIYDWFRADELEPGDFIGFPLPIETTKVGTIAIPFTGKTNANRYPCELVADYDAGRFIGLWFAEGHANNGISFDFHIKERELVDFIKEFSINRLHLIAIEHPSTVSLATRVRISNRSLGRVFEKWYAGQKGQKRPEFSWIGFPEDFVRGIVTGLMEGDGCLVADSQLTYASVSEPLAIFMRLCLLRLGIFAAISTFSMEGFQDRYTLNICGNDAKRLRTIMNKENGYVPCQSRTHFTSNDMIFTKIVSVEEVPSTNIRDISVDGECSFSSCTMLLHNTHYMSRPYPEAGGIGEEIPFVGPLVAGATSHAPRLGPLRLPMTKPGLRMHSTDIARASNSYEQNAGGVVPGYFTDDFTKSYQEQQQFLNSPGTVVARGLQPVSPTGIGATMGAMEYRSVIEPLGLVGFGWEAMLGKLQGKDSKSGLFEPPATYESSSWMNSFGRQYWDLNLGGLMGLTEFWRRFIPRRQYMQEYVNPIPNRMPHWVNASDRGIDFTVGDPYSKISEGELRLPGKGYESIRNVRKNFPEGASILGYSMEETVERLLNVQPPLDDEAFDVTTTGTYLHKVVQQQLARENMLVSAEKMVYDPYSDLSGYIDAIVKKGGEQQVVEIKTIDGEKLKTISAPRSKHYSQINFYMRAMKQRTGTILYVSRDDPRQTKAFDVYYSQDRYQRDLATLKESRMIAAQMAEEGFGSSGAGYSHVDRLAILADVAPYSKQYKEALQKVRIQARAGLLDEEETAKVITAQNNRTEKARRIDLYPNRFTNPEFYNYSNLFFPQDKYPSNVNSNEYIRPASEYSFPERLAGAAWEGFCLPGAELVETSEGYKTANRVQENDLVRTAKGNWKAVEKVWIRKPTEDDLLMIIQAAGHCIPLRTTVGHKIATTEGDKSAKDIRRGDWLLYPPIIYPTNMKDIDLAGMFPKLVVEKVDEEEFVRKKKSSKPFPRKLKKTQALWRFFGYYFSRGGLIRSDGGNHGVRMGFANRVIRDDAVRTMLSLLVQNSSQVIDGYDYVKFNSPVLAMLVEETIGDGEYKRIPAFILEGDDVLLLSFLKGIFMNRSFKSLTKERPDVLLDISKLLLHFKIAHKLQRDSGRNYKLEVDEHELAARMGLPLPTEEKQEWKMTFNDDGSTNMLVSNARVDYHLPAELYDFTVFEDHTYCTGLFAVHNSHMDTPLHTRFLPYKSPSDEYERTRVYGRQASFWEHPYRDFIEPWTMTAVSSDTRAGGAAHGAFIGSMLGGPAGLLTGAYLGGFYGGAQGTYFSLGGKRWVPDKIEREREMESYFDKLEYLKAKKLHELTGNPEYEQTMSETMTGMNPYAMNSTGWTNIFRAIPYQEKPFLTAFLQTTDPSERKKITQLVPADVSNFLQLKWAQQEEGSNAKAEQSFRDMQDVQKWAAQNDVPTRDWSGWSPGSRIEDIQLKSIKQEGWSGHDFGLGWKDQMRRINLSPFQEDPIQMTKMANAGIGNIPATTSVGRSDLVTAINKVLTSNGVYGSVTMDQIPGPYQAITATDGDGTQVTINISRKKHGGEALMALPTAHRMMYG